MNWFNQNNKHSKLELTITTLFIHAARLDGVYDNKEKDTIILCLKKLGISDEKYIDGLLKKAEKEEENNHQILHLTRELKKINYEERLKIIEMLVEIIYADKKLDEFEDNLIRRVAGLTYIDHADLGTIKIKVKEKLQL